MVAMISRLLGFQGLKNLVQGSLKHTIQVSMTCRAYILCGQRVIQSPDKNEKLLGLFIQSNLKWQYHLDQLRIRLNSQLAGLERLKFIAPQSSLKLISQGIFDSTLLYCLPLFCGCEATELKSLQVLQNRAAQNCDQVSSSKSQKLDV